MQKSVYTDVLPNQRIQPLQDKIIASDGFVQPKSYMQDNLKPISAGASESDSNFDPENKITSKVIRRKINLHKPASQHEEAQKAK